jgi:hypothetical protein
MPHVAGSEEARNHGQLHNKKKKMDQFKKKKKEEEGKAGAYGENRMNNIKRKSGEARTLLRSRVEGAGRKIPLQGRMKTVE